MQKYRIDQIKLGLDESPEAFEEKIRKKLGSKGRGAKVSNIKILRRAIDGRGKDVKWVYNLSFDSDVKLSLQKYEEKPYEIHPIDRSLEDMLVRTGKRPIIVGFGPCGMFATLVLAEAGLRPLVLERGSDVDSRTAKVNRFWESGVLDPECNMQFGEGGAGTFSDGKLNTGIKDPRIGFVLKTMVEAGASPDILIDGRPHVGTDVLVTVVKNIRERIKNLGGEIRFDTKVEEILFEEEGKDEGETIFKNRVAGVRISSGEEIEGSQVILAIGHSARDTVRNLYGQGIQMESKPFSMGVRVEHSQDLIDKGIYGESAGHPSLPPAYYKLSYRAGDGRGVYSFCMCPGGEIVNASSQEGGVCTNGMSNSERDSGKANSGILVDIRPEDCASGMNNPLAGMYFQEKYEKLAFSHGGKSYKLPESQWKDFLAAVEQGEEKSDSAKAGENPVVDSLPSFVAKDIAEAMPFFGKRIPGFDGPETRMVGIEARSSSPVRILRDGDTMEAMAYCEEESFSVTEEKKTSIIKGLYPTGEGAGYAGGITSAAVDGIKIAERIILAISGRL